jgi:hypothetical protein
MADQAISVGTLVVNRGAPEWGPGKVLAINGPQVKIFFRSREGRVGQSPIVTLRLPEAPLEVAVEQADQWFDHIPIDRHGEPVVSRRRLSMEQAVEKFRRYFPLGFEDPVYLGDTKRGERLAKWSAHTLWLESLGEGKGQALLKAGEVARVTQLAKEVVGRVSALAQFDAAAFEDALKAPQAATAFFRATFELLSRPEPDKKKFENLAKAAENLPLPEGKGKISPARWTLMTLLPFLARPDTFMFLRPDVTKNAAEILGFDLMYDVHPNWRTYRQLHRLAKLLMKDLKPLGAADWIDVQSFMWVVSDRYTGTLAPSAVE